MYKENRIAVVIPAFNEEKYIAEVLQTLPNFVDSIILVDDCSTDDTCNVATNVGDPRLKLIKLPENQGAGHAMIVGYREALEVKSDIIVKMDGDGQMHPDYIQELLDEIIDGQYDYSKGNRFMGWNSLEQMPRNRVFGNFVLTFLTKLASGYWQIFDVENGYTAIRASALEKINLDQIATDHFFINDMLVHLNIENSRVKDVAMPSIYGTKQSTIVMWRAILLFPIMLVRRFFFRIFRKYVIFNFHPISLFLFSGLLLFGFGFLIGLYLLGRNIFSGGGATPTGLVMISVVPLFLGFQLLLQAIVLDIQETPK